MKENKNYLSLVLSIAALLAIVCGIIVWTLLIWHGTTSNTEIYAGLAYKNKSFWQFLMDCWLILVAPFALGGVLSIFVQAADEEISWIAAVFSALGAIILSIILAIPMWFMYLCSVIAAYLFIYLPLSLIGAGDWIGLAIFFIVVAGIFGSGTGGQIVGVIFFWWKD